MYPSCKSAFGLETTMSLMDHGRLNTLALQVVEVVVEVDLVPFGAAAATARKKAIEAKVHMICDCCIVVDEEAKFACLGQRSRC